MGKEATQTRRQHKQALEPLAMELACHPVVVESNHSLNNKEEEKVRVGQQTGQLKGPVTRTRSSKQVIAARTHATHL